MAMLTVGAAPLPQPHEYKVSVNDLDSDSTERSESGILTRNRVRAGVYRLDVSWHGLTKAELKSITDEIDGASFSLTFFDPTQSSDSTKTMYAGDKSGQLSLYKTDGGSSYWDFTCAFIEF
jgi:hypothetical protein